MAAYVIVFYDVTDQEAYGPYVPGVVPLLEKHGAEILVADFEPQNLEGDTRGVAVVLKFPSADAATRWYNDPAYTEVKKIRLNSTKNGSMHLAAPFVAPAS